VVEIPIQYMGEIIDIGPYDDVQRFIEEFLLFLFMMRLCVCLEARPGEGIFREIR